MQWNNSRIPQSSQSRTSARDLTIIESSPMEKETLERSIKGIFVFFIQVIIYITVSLTFFLVLSLSMDCK